MNGFHSVCVGLLVPAGLWVLSARGADQPATRSPALPAPLRGPSLFARDNLVAWCIVPFDAKKRGPKDRVAMLQRLGIKRVAYDWRDEHVPQWDEEMEQYQKHGIELVGFWVFNDKALELMKRHKIKTQFWVMLPVDGKTQAERVEAAARQIEAIARKALTAGCTVALYNHGGWGGEPENQIAVIELLKARGISNVGICYNLHHAHDRLKDFPELLKKMLPYLWCLNLNGMGDQMILPIGRGKDDLGILKTIVASGYRGPIGILCHRDVDAEEALAENIGGLKKLLEQLGDKAAIESYGGQATR